MNAQAKLIYTARIPVRWGDMDAYGHVNNTVYFRFFEQARCEWIEHMGFRVSPEEATGPVIINASCTFLAPVNYPATVIIKMYAGDPGRSSVMTWYELFIEGKTACMPKARPRRCGWTCAAASRPPCPTRCVRCATQHGTDQPSP